MEREELGWAFVLGFIIIVTSNTVTKYASHGVSVAILVCFIFAVSYLFARVLRHRHKGKSLHRCRRDMLFVGFLWLIMSAVAMVIGNYYTHGIANKLLWSDYNIFKGKFKALVWLSELAAPYMFGALLLRRKRRSRTDERD